MPEVKIVCANEGLATNVEALAMLRERRSTRKREDGRLALADDVMDKAIAYLERTPAGQQTSEEVAQCVQKLDALSPEERLQIVNLAPDSSSTVAVICSKSLSSDDDVDKILKLSAAHLRGKPTQTQER